MSGAFQSQRKSAYSRNVTETAECRAKTSVVSTTIGLFVGGGDDRAREMREREREEGDHLLHRSSSISFLARFAENEASPTQGKCSSVEHERRTESLWRTTTSLLSPRFSRPNMYRDTCVIYMSFTWEKTVLQSRVAYYANSQRHTPTGRNNDQQSRTEQRYSF